MKDDRLPNTRGVPDERSGRPATGRAGRWENPPLASELAADATAAAIPHAARQVLEGLTHVADPKVIAPVLERFYTE